MTKPKTTPEPVPVPADLPPAPPEADPVVARERAEAIAAAQRAAQALDAAHGAVEMQREVVAEAEREEREHAEAVASAQAAVDRAAQALDEARAALQDAEAERDHLAAVARAAGLTDEDANAALLQAAPKIDRARAALQIAEDEAKRTDAHLRAIVGEGSGHRGQWPVPSDTPQKSVTEKAKLDRLRANFERRTAEKERADAALAAIDEARERRRKAFSDRFPTRCAGCRYWIPSGSPSRAGSGECHAAPPTSGSWPATDGANSCGRCAAIA